MKGIYAIIDLIAEEIIGVPMIHRHEASAVRMFQDIATMDGSTIKRHPQDYQLVRLGYIDDSNSVVADKKIVLEGKAWAALNGDTDAQG